MSVKGELKEGAGFVKEEMNEHGKSPEMKAMAKKIFAAQKKEIAEFDQWMSKHP